MFLTESVFQGRVFVVGHSNDEHCVSHETGRRTTSISVRKDQCGVVTTRSVCFILTDVFDFAPLMERQLSNLQFGVILSKSD